MTEKPSSYVRLLGDAEVGACGLSVRADDVHLLVDAGQGLARRWGEEFGSLEAVLLTHAHLDHCGALPEILSLTDSHEQPLVWASRRTKQLLPSALSALDSVSAGRARALADRVRTAPMRRWWHPGREREGPRAILFPAGHIAGARSVMVEADREDQSSKFRLFYTGDVCTHDQPVTPGAEIPAGKSFRPDLMVTESTIAGNAEMENVDLGAEWSKFKGLAEEAAGTTLVAVPSIGLAQEVLRALAESDLRVTAHERLRAPTEAYDDRDGSVDWIGDVRFAPERELRSLIGGTNVLVAPGAQCESGTPAGRLARRLTGDRSASLVLLRECFSRHLGGALQDAVRREASDAPREIDSNGASLTVRCNVETVLLPNHAPKWQLLQMVRSLEPRSLWVVHGPKQGRESLKAAVDALSASVDADMPERGDVWQPSTPQREDGTTS